MKQFTGLTARIAIATLAVGSAAFAAPAVATADTGSLDTGSSILQDWFGIDFGSLGGGGSPKVQKCDATTKSGGQGVTETTHLLGRRGPTSFVLSYETLNQPDEIRVFYQGRQIYSTGYIGDNINQGTGSARVNVPAGAAAQVTVRVTGPESGTQWQYTVHCPS